MTLTVEVGPCLRDNYAYVLSAGTDGPSRDGRSGAPCVVVDPSEPGPVLRALAGRPLAAIWCTHHHADHVGGIAELRARAPRARIVGSAHDGASGRIPFQDVMLEDGDEVPDGGAGLPRSVALHVPGHTLGALALLVGGADLFTGDTLFAAGCGRLFEGDAAMMRASLTRLRRLPPDVRVWCGHEYTLRNLAFARDLCPSDSPVAARIVRASAARAQDLPTVPSTIAEERATNPFLRWDDPAMAPAISSLAGGAAFDADTAFALLRRAKDVA